MDITTRTAALASCLTLLSTVIAPAPAQGQDHGAAPGRALTFRIGAEATLSTALADDANGTTVSYGLGPALALSGAKPVGNRVTGTVTARIARSPVHVDYGDPGSRSEGSAWVVDAVAALEGPVAFCSDTRGRGCTSLHGGAGVVWATGPDDLFPFSTHSGPRLAVELGGAIQLSETRPLHLTFAGQAFRYGGDSVSDPIAEPGTVFRVFLGVRHGR